MKRFGPRIEPMPSGSANCCAKVAVLTMIYLCITSLKLWWTHSILVLIWPKTMRSCKENIFISANSLESTSSVKIVCGCLKLKTDHKKPYLIIGFGRGGFDVYFYKLLKQWKLRQGLFYYQWQQLRDIVFDVLIIIFQIQKCITMAYFPYLNLSHNCILRFSMLTLG